MFYTKPAMRVNGHLFPIVAPAKLLSGVSSNRGVDDPIVTFTITNNKFPAGTLVLVRRAGASPTGIVPVTNPIVYLSNDGTSFIDESVGNAASTLTYTVSSIWVKYFHPVIALNATSPYGLWSRTFTISNTPAGNKPSSPTGTLVFNSIDSYIEGRKNKPNLSVVNSNQIQITFLDSSGVETGFVIERSIDGGLTWPVSYSVGPRTGTGGVFYTDIDVMSGVTYTYRAKTVKSTSLHDSAYTWPSSISF